MNMRVTGLFTAVALACASTALAQERFDTPDAAAQALIAAAEIHDSARLAAIIGPQSGAVLTSGSPAQDRDEQTEFARLAQAKRTVQISAMNPNRAILSIGDQDWPFPVPICRTNGKWRFDPSETPQEIRARRIGANELDAIEVLHGYVDAQRKFASEDRDRDGMLEYAPRLMSNPGRRDGLYWKGAEQPLVPEGLALAASTGGAEAQAKPYHGYYFRILTEQGPNAPDGAHHYMVKNRMIGGFGLVAWPAEYGVAGIHTFIVNQDGVVYQKDMAPAAGKPTAQITRFDPDPSWRRVE